jgi:hypothetical protein
MLRRTLVLLLVAATAHAGDDDLHEYRNWVDSLRVSAADHEGASFPDPKGCRSDATLCDEYAELVAMAPAAAKQKATAISLRLYGDTDPASLGDGMGEVFVDDGKACVAETEKALKAGAPADRATTIDGRELTLAEGKTQICEAMIAFGEKLTGDIADAHAAARAEVAAKYEAVGIKGARLELFIEYDDVYWRGKGCERVTDLKKLAKAKALFHWLENADGTHTIRKYTFKGNKVKSVKDRTYLTEARAWKGCK